MAATISSQAIGFTLDTPSSPTSAGMPLISFQTVARSWIRGGMINLPPSKTARGNR
jgi:hypothetical protein